MERIYKLVLVGNINTMKRETEAPLDNRKDAGLEVIAEATNYVFFMQDRTKT
jgi:hypothetical protein